VTGNEPAIAGYPEGTYNAPSCMGYLSEARVQPLDLLDQLLAVANLLSQPDSPTDLAKASYKLGYLTADCQMMPFALDVECGYEGQVDAQWAGDRKGNGEFFWTCPRCGSERAESREAGDDHPDL